MSTTTTHLSHYEILGVDSTASSSEIKAAFRKLARLYHPDANGGKQSHLFSLVNQAYEVLGDSQRREDYDRLLASGQTSTSSNFSSNESYSSSQQESQSAYTATPLQVLTSPVVNIDDLTKDLTFTEEHIIPPLPTKRRIQVLFGISAVLWIAFAALAFAVSFGAAFIVLFTLSAIGSLAFYKTKKHNATPVFLWGLGILALGLGSFGLVTSGSIGPFAFAALSAGAIFLSTHAIKLLRKRRLATETTLSAFSVEAAKIKVLGVPADGLWDATDKFSPENLDKGIVGEMMTGDALEVLLSIPGVRIFHGMRFPGSQTADVDHAVIYDNKVAFIDSKLWAPAHYGWGRYGEITVNEGRALDRSTNFSAAVEHFNKLLPEMEVTGWMLVHSYNPRQRSTFDNAFATNVYMGDADFVIRNIAEWFLQSHTGVVNRHMLARLWEYKQ